jgi:LAO/AO transport system kinase
VLDAAGKDVIAIETVGVGQDEVDIAGAADVSLVVLVPGMGDDVQALKAGVMEIADIFVVNKADREGTDRAVAEIESVLALHQYGDGEWRPPIIRTQATTGQGLDALVEAIQRFLDREPTIESRRRTRMEAQLRSILAVKIQRLVETRLPKEELKTLVDRMAARRTDPYTAADEVLAGAEAPEARAGARGPRDNR